jgi:hypothetical protein
MVKRHDSGVPGVHWDEARQIWTARLGRKLLGRRKDLQEAIALRVNAQSGIFTGVQEKIDLQMRGRALDKLARVRMRSVWRDLPVGHGWASFEHFVATVGDRPTRMVIVPKNTNSPVGPDNFQWIMGIYHPLNKDSRNAFQRAHRAANLDHYRDVELRKRFGITLAQYNELLEDQGGVCAICAQPETAIRQGRVLPLSVDHNHRTGALRGLLCTACNIGIGSLAESEERLDAAKAYLQKWKARETVVLPENVVPLKRNDQ